MTTITRVVARDIRFPTSRDARRVRRHERGPGLLGRLRRAPDRRPGSRATASPSPSAAATSCASPPSGARAAGRRQDARVDHRRHGRVLARSPATASCAGSARRRASSTWPPPRSSTRCGTSRRRPRASRSGSCSADMTPGAARRVHRFPLHHRRAHARRGARDPASQRAARGRARSRDAARDGYPAYTTSAGWLGYPDDKMRALAARRSARAGRTSR